MLTIIGIKNIKNNPVPAPILEIRLDNDSYKK
jgi:hypothetical protein